MRKKSFRLPSNQSIVAALVGRFHDRIVGASYNIGRRYLLQPEDREELVSHVHMKIAKVDWRRIFREDMAWIAQHHPKHKPTWASPEVAQVMNGYAYTLIRKSMLDEVRRIKCGGITGLGLHPLDSIRPHKDDGLDFSLESEWETEEPSADGIGDRQAATQVAEMAKRDLSPDEWSVCELSFGFDGGGTRTPTQVAREAGMPRKRVQQLIEAAMGKMRLRLESPQ